MLGIRNPKAHAPFEELDERRALDYLGLASLLMRRLNDVEIRAELRCGAAQPCWLAAAVLRAYADWAAAGVAAGPVRLAKP